VVSFDATVFKNRMKNLFE